jgi:hypothetical protein
MSEDWKPTRAFRPPEGLRVKVRRGPLVAYREIKSIKDCEGVRRFLWWDGYHFDETHWEEYQEMPNQQMDGGPGFC